MKITLKNIQSIKHAVYELEESGITQITGDNSNGKSIVRKALTFVGLCKIKDKEEREPLINDEVDYGSIKLERNGYTLGVLVHREREQCYYSLTRPNGEKVLRYVREGGLEQLASEFGFAAYDKNTVLLQVLKVNSLMPFISDRPSLDYEIVESIVTDPVANMFLQNYEKVTYPALKEQINTLKYNIDHFTGIASKITFTNIEEAKHKKAILEEFYNNIGESFAYYPEILPIMEDLQYIDVPQVSLKEIPVMQILPEVIRVESIQKDIDDLLLTVVGVCPLCKGKLNECEDYNLVLGDRTYLN